MGERLWFGERYYILPGGGFWGIWDSWSPSYEPVERAQSLTAARLMAESLASELDTGQGEENG